MVARKTKEKEQIEELSKEEKATLNDPLNTLDKKLFDYISQLDVATTRIRQTIEEAPLNNKQKIIAEQSIGQNQVMSDLSFLLKELLKKEQDKEQEKKEKEHEKKWYHKASSIISITITILSFLGAIGWKWHKNDMEYNEKLTRIEVGVKTNMEANTRIEEGQKGVDTKVDCLVQKDAVTANTLIQVDKVVQEIKKFDFSVDERLNSLDKRTAILETKVKL
jgi:hypothetical protein